MVIRFWGGLRGDKVSLVSLEGMLNFWEETRKRRNISHIMVTLRGRFKGETSEKGHVLPLVDVTISGIEIRKWVGRWLEILMEDDGIR